MNGKGHFISTLIFFMTLWLICSVWLKKEYFTITQVIAALSISYFPDVDKNFDFLSHRNWFTHSTWMWIIIYFYNQHFIFLLMVLGIGFHCLCDIRISSKKQKGYYTIKWFKGRGMNGTWSTVYLIINFLLAFGLFTYVMVIY